MVENEEASASVVVKMTDSFTEQADQVTQKRPYHAWGRGAPGRGTHWPHPKAMWSPFLQVLLLWLWKPDAPSEGNGESRKKKYNEDKLPIICF